MPRYVPVQRSLPPSPALPLLPAAWLLCTALHVSWAADPDGIEPEVAEPLPETLGAVVAPRGVDLRHPPAILPGSLPRTDKLADLAQAMVHDQREVALVLAQDLADHLRDRRERAAAWMVVGMLHREAGRANLASEAFTQVRASGGPLAAWGAWYEAEQDLERGREAVAIRECSQYLARWSEGAHAEDCEQLIAFGQARLGQAADAEAAAQAWDEAHPKAPISEQVQLTLADWEMQHDPPAAVRRLSRLTVWFQAPLTIRIATQALAELRRRGIAEAIVPDDPASLRARAISLRDSGSKRAAWQLFNELASASADDPALSAWIAAESTTFGWRTHQWDFLAATYAQRAAEEPSEPDHAWMLYRSLDRGGRYAEAAEVCLDGLARFDGVRPWRGEHERIGRTLMLARRYDDARTLFDGLSDRSGITGLRNAYYAAFSAVMLGDAPDARRRLDALVDDNAGLVTEARYWRAQLVEATDPELAASDRAWIASHDASSWYARLLGTPQGAPRSGRWVGSPAPAVRPAATLPATAPAPMAAVAHGAIRERAPGFAEVRWPMPAAPTPDLLPAPVRTSPGLVTDYPPSLFHDPTTAREAFADFVRRHSARWPDLLAVQDLASVGLHDLSGPLFARFYDDWVKAVKRRDPEARAIGSRLEKSDWRDLFVHARDHHHATRFTWGLERHAPPEQQQAVLALALPKAHAHHVWQASRRHQVDPYLVLGLMRTESLYNANAVSRVGARGPMQIMPRTGHLLADRVDDVGFHVGRLHDPDTAIGYGIRYLGLLLDRFDGVFPLAVAAYNGGPHNVSAWMRGAGDLPLDAFIEHIPYGETRRYVRSVTERYATYAALYAGTEVELPAGPLGDHPDIVDF